MVSELIVGSSEHDTTQICSNTNAMPDKKWKKNQIFHYFDVFQLWNRFWSLPDGYFDPLDRYKNLFFLDFWFFKVFLKYFAYKPIVDSLKSGFEGSRQ